MLNSSVRLFREWLKMESLKLRLSLRMCNYWIRPQEILSADKGAHRFLWDMHYMPLNVRAAYPISAVYKNTAPEETSPWVMPGNYKARLTVDGKTYEHSFSIKMDPRVKTSVIFNNNMTFL